MLEELECIGRARELARSSSERWAGSYVKEFVTVCDDAIPRLGNDMIRLTIKAAEALLSSPGAPLVCDEAEWLTLHYTDPDAGIRRRSNYESWTEQRETLWAGFRPSDLWQHISAKYDPDRVVREARERAALEIVQTFGLYGRAVKFVGGRIELALNRNSECCYDDSRLRRYGHSYYSDMVRLGSALDVFGAASGLDLEKVHIGRLARALLDVEASGFRFSSRDRQDFPGPLSIVFFNSEIKIYLSADAGQALNIFLSTYAAEEMAKECRWR